jgi:hypothetical protein
VYPATAPPRVDGIVQPVFLRALGCGIRGIFS